MADFANDIQKFNIRISELLISTMSNSAKKFNCLSDLVADFLKIVPKNILSNVAIAKWHILKVGFTQKMFVKRSKCHSSEPFFLLLKKAGNLN